MIESLTSESSASFRDWQSTYAEHGVATFPVEFVPDGSGALRKKPMVGNYGCMGLRASAKLADRFGDERALGFTPGRRNGITVADIDEPGDAALARCLTKHGDTPVLVESTATGKHHAYYRFNGEKRIVRPEQDVALDILGHQDGAGNFVVAAPSVRPGGAYRFIRGSVADLGNLSVMRNVPRNALITSPEIDSPIPDDFVPLDEPFEEMEIAPQGIRDKSLWTACMKALGAGRVRSYQELIALARQWNAERCVPPQPEKDLMHAVDSAWDYTTRGKNWFGRPGVHFFSDEARRLIDNDLDLYRLVSFVRLENRPGRRFILTNTFCKRWGWSRQHLAAVRKRAMAQGFFRCVRRAVSGHAAEYVWSEKNRAGSK
jgi:hypothetical protein